MSTLPRPPAQVIDDAINLLKQEVAVGQICKLEDMWGSDSTGEYDINIWMDDPWAESPEAPNIDIYPTETAEEDELPQTDTYKWYSIPEDEIKEKAGGTIRLLAKLLTDRLWE